MNWQKIFFYFKKNGQKPITAKLDQKLVSRLRSKLFPSWSQLKYVGYFLNNLEKTIIKILIAVVAISIISWLSIFIFANRVVVPDVGGEYIEGIIDQPKFVNPLFANTSDVDADLTSLIYSGLFRYNENQKLVPDLAVNYTIDKNKKIYTIKLRQDAKWSDGENLTADDIIFTFETIQNPSVNSPLLLTFQNVKIKKLSDDSIQFTLKEPFAPFLSSLTFGILPQHIWGEISPSNIKLAKNNLQPIGSGGWKLDKLTKDEIGNIKTYVLAPNKYYYKQLPYLKNLIFKFYNDYTQAISALKSQEITGLSFVPNNLKQKISNNNYNFYSFNLPQYNALFFNQEARTDLVNIDLRQALTMSIEKNKIIGAINNEGEIIDSPFSTNYLGASTTAKFIKYDIKKANTLLDKKWKKIQPEEYFKIRFEKMLKEKNGEIEALKKTSSNSPETVSSTIATIEKNISDAIRQEMNADQSFYRSDSNNNILKFTITTVNTSEYKTIAEATAKMWRAVGITVEINLVDGYQIISQIINKRDYEILLYGEILGADPDPYPFWHSSQINYPGFNLAMFDDSDVDKILENARTETSETKRLELYKKFANILNTELPAVFLYKPNYTMAITKAIKGISLAQIFHPADRFANINNWYIKTKQEWRKK
jgi:peptide/nickel transport system substrate-binding protein